MIITIEILFTKYYISKKNKSDKKINFKNFDFKYVKINLKIINILQIFFFFFIFLLLKIILYSFLFLFSIMKFIIFI